MFIIRVDHGGGAPPGREQVVAETLLGVQAQAAGSELRGECFERQNLDVEEKKGLLQQCSFFGFRRGRQANSPANQETVIVSPHDVGCSPLQATLVQSK